MPFLKKQKGTPLSVLSEIASRRTGFRPFVNDGLGSSYTGDWLDNKRHGKGKCSWYRGKLLYNGDWKDNKISGQGKLFTFNPSMKDYFCNYSGNWEANKRNGFGSNIYGCKEAVYEGEWKNDQRHGHGKMTFSNGNVYEGMWFKDEPKGKGYMQYASGNSYSGDWLNGKRHGYGQYEMSNGDVFIGSWRYDRKNGSGQYIFASQNILTGVWVNDIPRCGAYIEENNKEFPLCTLVDPDTVVEDASEFFMNEASKISEDD